MVKQLTKNKFYEKTTFEGFGFINDSKSKKEVSFWYVVVFLFLSITIFKVAQSVIHYISGPTLTVVDITSAKNDSLPSFYLILGVTPMEFSNWVGIENETDGFVRLNVEQIIKSVKLSSLGNTTELLHLWYNKNGSCSPQCAELAEQIGFIPDNDELLLNILLRLYFLQMDPMNYAEVQRSYPDLEKALKARELVESGEKLGLLMNEIIEKVSDQLVKMLGIFVVSEDLTVAGRLILQGIRILPTMPFPKLEIQLYPKFPENSMVKSIVCLWLLNKPAELVNKHRNINSSFSYDKYFKSYYDKNFYLFFKDSKELMFAWIPDHPMTRVSKVSTFNFVITGKHNRHTNKSCFPGPLPAHCAERCLSQVFMKFCDCSPWDASATLPKPLKSLLCDARTCPMNETIFNQLIACKDIACNEDNFCQTILYRIDNSEYEFLDVETPIGKIVVKLKENARYPIFDLQYTYTLTTFIAELGGQMSAWIGVTFIGLLQAIILLASLLTKICRRKDKIDGSQPQLEVEATSSTPKPGTTTIVIE